MKNRPPKHQSEARRPRDQQPGRADAPKRSRLRWGVAFGLFGTVILAGAWTLVWVPHLRIRRAENAIESWQFEDAKRQLEGYPSWGLQAAKAYFLRARVDRLQDGYVHALENLRIAKAGGYDSQAIAREQSLLKIQNGVPISGLPARLDTFLKQSPDDRAAIYQVFANALFHQGNGEQAMEVLEQWSELSPNDSRPYYWEGMFQQLLGDRDAALAAYRKSTERSPQLLDAYLAIGKISLERSEYKQALESYQLARQLAPHRIDVRIDLATVLWKMQQESEAVELLEPIWRDHPSIFPSGQMIAQHYTRRQMPEKVIATLEPMMQHFPEDKSLNYMLGSAYHALGDEARMQASMQKYITANNRLDVMRAIPFDYPLDQQYDQAMRRASMYRRFGRKRSLKWLNLAAQCQPANPQPHAFLASFYRENGAIDEAIRQQNLADSLSQFR